MTKPPKAAKKPAARAPGRPSKLTAKMSSSICSKMAAGESLRSICRDKRMPSLGTVFRWVANNDVFREQYEAAMAQRAESLFEEILEIADDTALDTVSTKDGERPNAEWISRSRLRVDARKWMLSKMLPKKYGDKLAIGGATDLPPLQSMPDTELHAKIALLMAKNGSAEQD